MMVNLSSDMCEFLICAWCSLNCAGMAKNPVKEVYSEEVYR